MYILAGAVVVVLVMVDVLWTTLTTQGGGFLSSRVVRGMHWSLAAIDRRFRGHWILAGAGPIVIVALAMIWIGGLWLGWFLIFHGIPGGIVKSSTAIPADLSGQVYFVGFTLSTLGVGDMAPAGASAQVLTAIASFNGLMLATLVITYAVPLVSAAVARRKLAYTIHLMGGSPDRLWDNFKDVEDFAAWLGSIRGDITECVEQRLAYPVLDLFFSPDKPFSLGLQLAILAKAAVQAESPAQDWSKATTREMAALHKLVYRYALLTGITTSSTEERLKRLAEYAGWDASALG